MGTLSTPPASSQPTRVRYGVLAFACSLALLTYLDRICIMQAKEPIKADLGLSEDDWGLVLGAFLLGYLALEVPGGWLGDRWGARRVLVGMVLCWSLFTALTGCVSSLVLDALTAMLLIRFLFGLGEAGAFPNLTRIIHDWFPLSERAFVLGWIWACARLGGAFAPPLLNGVTRLLGWRQAFWLFGLLGLGWCWLFYRHFRDRPHDNPHCNEAERTLIGNGSSPLSPPHSVGGEGGGGHAWPSLRVLAGSPTVWAMCAVSFFINLAWYFYATWQPKYWDEVHGIASIDSGWLTGAPFLCGAVGNLLGGRWSDRMLRRGGSRRWSRALVGMSGLLLAGLCILATGFASTPWQAETLLCLGFLANDLSVPIIWAVCPDVGGRFAGSLSGLMNMIGGFGGVLSATLLPRVHRLLHEQHDQRVSWSIIFAGLAAFWFLSALSWLFIDAGKPLAFEE
jgi:ACS family glucarate transporter-like MFS transporter